MKNNPYFIFLMQFFCWLLFFQITHFVFALYNWQSLAGPSFAELITMPFRALYLDVAMSCYFMGLPWFLVVLAQLLEQKWPWRINQIFTGLLVVLVSALVVGELPIYDEWQSKVSYKAVSMLAMPTEVFRTATNRQLFGGVAAIIALSLLGIWLFKKAVFTKNIQPRRRPVWALLLFILLVPGALVLGMRGGFQQIPIQISDAYYSKYQVLNAAATNSVFFLMSSYIHHQHAGKPYHFMPDEEAEALFQASMQPMQDTTAQVFSVPKPNIVMVILESWSADLVGACGGFEGITPQFDSLAKNGILFTHCYSSGLRSDQGMASIFSAFPAQPKTSIIRMPNKFQRLPCINTALKGEGYTTSFLFGGQLSYGNIRSYMFFNGFDKIIEGKGFDKSVPQCKLGVADEYLFERQLEELSKERQPFFAAMFTLSSHSPYDMPMEPVIDWGDKDRLYLNSVFYADRCLGEFMEKARQTDWYANTIFIFLADHGHGSPKGWASHQPEYRRIPLLFYGEAIRPEFWGNVDSLPTTQSDVAATLLKQLGLDAEPYSYSHDLFNPGTQRSAFYTFDEGFGWIKADKSQACWHVKDDRVEFVKPENDSLALQQNLKEGKAWLQVLVKDYFDF